MRTFYAGVVGWTPKVVAQDDMTRPPTAGEKGYTLFTMRGQEVAGAEEIEAGDAADPRSGWFAYVQVDNVDEAAERAAKHGGKVVQQPFDVPGVGRIAEIEDPEGNRVGLVSPRA
jgi:predicted enzyme related to lactoylglutathione lyase